VELELKVVDVLLLRSWTGTFVDADTENASSLLKVAFFVAAVDPDVVEFNVH
jgi:hypothetical protein